ncbi:dihydrofolate reductase family protein [Sphingomonas sp.]|uniref:dihydrofolate reductase family protein n=1 Tax=Sphingomonas sp. TaxID=28214 RepID=UPI003CC66C7D
MRRLTGAAFVSLDGVMQAPGGPTEDPTGGFANGGWVFGVWDPVVETALGEVFTPPYDLLLGRRTYDIFAAHWPYVTGDEAGMGQALTAATKHVVTRHDDPLPWANSRRLAGTDAVGTLKESDGPDLLIQGSSTLYPPLLAAGLIDRLILMTFPVVLGRGKRLFGDGTPPGALRLTGHAVGEHGVTVGHYAIAGAVRTGTPPDLPPPSDRERARQRAMAEGSW